MCPGQESRESAFALKHENPLMAVQSRSQALLGAAASEALLRDSKRSFGRDRAQAELGHEGSVSSRVSRWIRGVIVDPHAARRADDVRALWRRVPR